MMYSYKYVSFVYISSCCLFARTHYNIRNERKFLFIHEWLLFKIYALFFITMEWNNFRRKSVLSIRLYCTIFLFLIDNISFLCSFLWRLFPSIFLLSLWINKRINSVKCNIYYIKMKNVLILHFQDRFILLI